MRATIRSISSLSRMKKVFLSCCALVIASATVVACTDLTGPTSPETPTNVKATLVSATSATITWSPSPQSDGVVSYNILRNGTKVGESPTTSFTDIGLAGQTTYKYAVSANCTSGLLSDPSAESAAATITTLDVTPPHITLISPAAGQTGVSTGATVTVTFNEAMDPTTINTTTFSLKVTDTGANIPGSVTYNTVTRVAEFTPSSPLPSAASITVTVTAGAKDLAGNALLLTAGSPGFWSFTTRDDQPPSVIANAVSPANGATGVSANAVVTVPFSEAMDATTINASNITLRVTSSGTSVGGTVTYNSTTHVASFTPSAPLATPVNYTLTVASGVKDVAGNAMGVNFQSTFTTADTTPPTVTSTLPANLATNVATNTVVSATFSKAMDATTINGTTFTLRATATGVPVTGTVAYNAATNTATFTPSAPLGSLTAYTATITTGAHDTFGNALAANFAWTFSTVDTTPPTVLSVSPANLATNVAVSSAVNITFSEAMDATTINGTTITLKNTTTSAAVAGVVTYNAATNVATFTPNVALAFSTGYTVTVTTGVKDVAGNAMASQFTSTFTTAAAPDTTPPTVVSTFPTGGATSIAIDTAVTVTFSEAMDPTTISSTTFTLKTTTGGTPVAGTVTYNAATFTAKFKPTSPLANNTGYTATVTTGAKDVAGNALAANKVFAFTTIPDTTPPTVTSTSPTNGTTNVAVTSVVTVTFSEAMDSASVVAAGTFTLKETVTSAAVTGTVTYNTATHVATFTPTASLAASKGYTATVTTAAKDLAGNALSPGTLIFSFTTGP
jgi:Bacterial Ig-like domain